MSSPKLKAALNDIVNIAQERKDSKKKSKDSLARSLAEKFHGQILILNKFDINATLTKYFQITLSNEELDEVFNGPIHTELKRRENGITWKSSEDKTRAYQFLKTLQIKNGDHAYIVSNFEAAKSSKYKAKNKGKDVASILSDYIKTKKGRAPGATELSAKFQLGHGERGIAASEFGLARAVSEASRKYNLGIDETQKLYTAIFTQRQKYKLETKVDHSQIYTSDGEFNKTFSFILSYQDRDINAIEGKLEEKAFVDTLQYYDWLKTQTSTLAPVAIGKVLTKALTGKNPKIIGNGKKEIKEKSKAKIEKIQTAIVNAPFQVVRGIDKKYIKAPKQSIKPQNLFSLLTLINAKLPETVEKNMGDPALNNVTGRFATSVRATDIGVTSQGFPSIGYTYNDIYRTFEVGNKQGSTERDPRRLVDSSIREIASQMAIGRFYTRRV